jgi:hypothetical protein
VKSGKMFVLLACLLSLGICANAHATAENGEGTAPMGTMQTVASSNHFSEDLGYAIGLKFWMNEWSLPVRLGSYYTSNAAILQFDSDSEFAFIPTFMVRYRNFFLGGSYMPKTEYEYSTQSTVYTIFDSYGRIRGVDRNVDVSAERTEWDLNLGYMLTPNIALSIGYKNLKRSYDLQVSYSADGYENENIDAPTLDESLNAPIFGLSSVFPIKGKLNLYNNFAYGLINGDADGYYYLGELGINYVIPLTQKMVSAIIINLGYRLQRLDLDYGYPGGDQNDTTSGFNLGVTAPF